MKILVMPSSINQINEIIDNVDGIIVGIDKLCINMPKNYSEKEIFDIIKICQNKHKEIFVSLNKNMFNQDLELLKNTLIKLDKLKINGILYYDIAIVNLKKELGLKTPLVWNQEHLATNYMTSNYWYNYGAKYTYLSSEITKEEINQIKKEAKGQIIVTLFGYLPMFVSRRNLVENYLETFKLENKSNKNFISKEGKKYRIIDNEDGTIAYSDYVLNGIKEMLDIQADYIVLNSFDIDDNKFKEVLLMFKNIDKDNVIKYSDKIDEMFKTSTGFLHEETIYRVKKNV